MKIFTDKKYREHIEQVKYERDKEEYFRNRLDRLTEDLHHLEWRVQVLEGKYNPGTTCSVPVVSATVSDGQK